MLRAGIVGLPNVGKSTLFNAVTRTRKAEAANYPFCTIEPNTSVVSRPRRAWDDGSVVRSSKDMGWPENGRRVSPMCLRDATSPCSFPHRA